jgi:hypothetical protein
MQTLSFIKPSMVTALKGDSGYLVEGATGQAGDVAAQRLPETGQYGSRPRFDALRETGRENAFLLVDPANGTHDLFDGQFLRLGPAPDPSSRHVGEQGDFGVVELDVRDGLSE